MIYHSAVLAHLDEEARRRFIQQIREVGARWIAQEGPGVVPGLPATPTGDTLTFVVVLDGRPVGLTAPHGDWTRWLAP